ncbi:HD domain-containing protein [Lactococcus lactis]|uniref:HD domain-containing protein n=1 Tax=Lactococcus lactis TaxID=1358 RepID=UPI0018C613D6|nr:HD domain-containing protein [Lactococcus lactis]MBG1279095.1 HD domain-containing protein [Lactococcus lactis subsp. lactis]
MNRLKKQVSFIEEIEKAKAVTRHNRTLDGRFENDAEHQWQGAVMASVFKEYYPDQLDMEKVIQMLLIHDLGEIYAGDTWAYDEKGKKNSHEKELISFNKSTELLPPDQSEELRKLWQEFEEGDSPEARYARIIDALVPLINHLVVSEENYNPENMTSEMVLKKKSFIKNESKELWKLVENLVQKSVEKGLYL